MTTENQGPPYIKGHYIYQLIIIIMSIFKEIKTGSFYNQT